MTMVWRNALEAPQDGQPFLLGTASGGVLLELWHWCADASDYRGCISKNTFTRLRQGAPDEVFLYARPPTPRLQQ